MDNLEKFISENRKAFDQDAPSERVWQSISKDILAQQSKNVARKIHLRWIVGIAAGLFMAVLLWNNFGSDGKANPAYAVIDPIIESIDPNYAIQARNYNQEIQAKQVALKELLKEFPDVSESLITDLDKLNQSYDRLRTDLVDNPNQKVLLKAMIENLNLQVSILNNQLNLISQIKNEAKNEINI